jgi:hypothetical protein
MTISRSALPKPTSASPEIPFIILVNGGARPSAAVDAIIEANRGFFNQETVMATSTTYRDEDQQNESTAAPNSLVLSFNADQPFIILTNADEPAPAPVGDVDAEPAKLPGDHCIRICANQLTEDDVYEALLSALTDLAFDWGMDGDQLLADVEDWFDATVCCAGE